MKRLLFFVLFLQLVSSIYSQSNGRKLNYFEIGADYVNNSNVEQWANNRVTNINSFPDNAWVNLKALGITMPIFHIDKAWNDNFPNSLVTKAHNDTMHISLVDDNLIGASLGERRYFQVEADSDFSSNNVGTLVYKSGFDIDGLRYDLSTNDRK